MKRYAREHRCGLSELIRDGLEMRLEADTPWHAAGRTRAPDAEVLQEVLHLLEAVLPTLRTQLQATVRETLPEVLQEVLQREASRIAAQGGLTRSYLSEGEEVSGPPVPANARGQTEVLPQQPVSGRRPEVRPRSYLVTLTIRHCQGEVLQRSYLSMRPSTTSASSARAAMPTWTPGNRCAATTWRATAPVPRGGHAGQAGRAAPAGGPDLTRGTR